MSDPLARPLVFGDKEQIEALKEAELLAEFKKLPKCDECGGEGECLRCSQECPNCDGVGRDAKAYQQFRERHPDMTGFRLSSLKGRV